MRFVVVASWACVAFIAYARVSLIDARPTLTKPGGFAHVAAFALWARWCAWLIQKADFCFRDCSWKRHSARTRSLRTSDRHGELVDALQKRLVVRSVSSPSLISASPNG
jgi:hypothetical protein